MKLFQRRLSLFACAGLAGAYILAGRPAEPPLRAQIAGCRWELAGRMPVPIADAAAAVDEGSGVAFVHGGVDRDGVVRNEVYRLDLRSAVAERLTTSGGNVTRWAHGAALHGTGARAGLLVVGGNTSTAPDFPAEKRVYTLDIGGKRWAITPVGGGMPAVQEQALAYDPLHGVVVFQGGRAANGTAQATGAEPQGETFVLDPATGLVSRGQRDGPALFGHSMVFDSQRRRMLIFGGTPDGKKGSDLVWELSLEGRPENGVWRQVAVSGAGPKPRFKHGAAYDAARQAMVVYGGMKIQGETLDDTWALDLSVPKLAVWRDLGAPHQKRSSILLLYDPISQHLLQISGGRPLGDQSSKDIHRLVCNAMPTAVPSTAPIIGPTETTAPTTQPTASPDPRLPTATEPATKLPPPVTIGTPTSTGAAPTQTPPPPPSATPRPADPTASPIYPVLPAEAALFLPSLLLRSPLLVPSAPASPTPAPGAPTGAPPVPSATELPAPTAAPPSCVIAEIEPNDRLTDIWRLPPLCPDLPAIGILDQGDGGDYLRLDLEAGELSLGLSDIPSGRDYDLLVYDEEGRSLGSSQQPGNLPEALTVRLPAGTYAVRVYPSIGRSPMPYELRWKLAP